MDWDEANEKTHGDFFAGVLSTNVVASDDVQLKRLFEYAQLLDERITKLEAQLKNAGVSKIVSDAPVAIGGWTDRSAWSKVHNFKTLEREALARLGSPTIKEGDGIAYRIIYEGKVNYLIGYVDIIDGKVVAHQAQDF